MTPKNVLVVGGAGYIGSHMVRELLDAGHRPIVLDNFSRGHRDLVLTPDLHEGDCGDRALLERIFTTERIDAVMHFAAYALVGESVQNPLLYWLNNAASTAVLLDSMIRHDVKRFIFSSTCATYGEPKTSPIDETLPQAPVNPYGRSKLACEQMMRECQAAHGLQFAALRYFNAAGAHPAGGIGERHDPESHLIPNVLKVALGETRNVSIFGTDYETPDGTCVRDYVHVCDLAQAHLLALDALFDGLPYGIYNLGTDTGSSVRQVIEVARAITGHAIPTVEGPRRPGDPPFLVASSGKAHRELGWKPKFSALDVIVRTAWDWHRADAARHR
jgi:UDP-glucose 4-epimerase